MDVSGDSGEEVDDGEKVHDLVLNAGKGGLGARRWEMGMEHF